MNIINSVEHLQSELQILKDMTVQLEENINELNEYLSKDSFIPKEINNVISDNLIKIDDIQDQLKSNFKLLNIGECPNTIEVFSDEIDKYYDKISEKNKYIESFEFFLCLESEDKEASNILNKHKNILKNINADNIAVDELEKNYKQYVLFKEFFLEEDQAKKFSLFYDVSQNFEKELVLGVQSGTINHIERNNNEICNIDEENNATNDNQKETELTNESKELNSIDDIEEYNDDEEPLENDSNDTVITWEELGIHNEQIDLVITKNDKEILNEFESQKTLKPFGVSKFKKEMNENYKAKVECLRFAYEGGFNKKFIDAVVPKVVKANTYKRAAEDLVTLGYLKTLKISDMGTIYTLSSKGEKIFTSKESRKYIINNSSKACLNDEFAKIENCNDAIVRLMSYSFLGRYKNELGEFNNIDASYGIGVTWCLFENDYMDYGILFLSVVSDNVETFKYLYDYISKLSPKDAMIIVVEQNQEKAKNIANWIKSINKEYDICYTWHKCNRYYDILDNCEIELLDFKTEDSDEISQIYKEELREDEEINVDLNNQNRNGNSEDIETEESSSNNTDLLKSINVLDEKTLFYNSDDSLMKQEYSDEALKDFVFTRFKSEINKDYEAKVHCLGLAYIMGFNKNTLNRFLGEENNPQENIKALYYAGYLEKITIPEFDSIYTLSKKGRMIFDDIDGMQFMRKNSMLNFDANRIIPITNYNTAAANALYCSTLERIEKLTGNINLDSADLTLNPNCYMLKYSDSLFNKDFLWIISVTNNPITLKGIYEYLIDDASSKNKRIIVNNINRDLSKAYANWISTIVSDIEILYTWNGEKNYFSLASDAAVDTLSWIKKNDYTEELETAENVSGETSKEECYDNQSMSLEKKAEIEKFLLTKENVVKKDELKDNINHNLECKKMLADNKSYAATAYLKSLSKGNTKYLEAYEQLAYAVNDPMAKCSYNSDNIFEVYFAGNNMASDYLIISAVIRNYFYDQFSYDYSLQQLQNTVLGNSVLKNDNIAKVVYLLQQFKKDNNRGMDCYAAYRKKEAIAFDHSLNEIKRTAKEYCETYCSGTFRENASHKRFLQTEKLLLGPGSEVSDLLHEIADDNRDFVSILIEYLKENFIKNDATIAETNIDINKLGVYMDKAWQEAGNTMKLMRKSSTLMSSLRNNLLTKLNKIVSLMCKYTTLLDSDVPKETEPAFIEYKKVYKEVLKYINLSIENLETTSYNELDEIAGKNVLLDTLKEIKSRIDGTYNEELHKYFYINFLRNDKVILNEDFFPALDEVEELPEFSLCNRILEHCKESEEPWEIALKKITSGGDNYGSGKLILEYLKTVNPDFKVNKWNMDKASIYAESDMQFQREGFIEDMELAQSYGKIDNTVENVKETIIQIIDVWYEWANYTKNYGFFKKILTEFNNRIGEDAQNIAIELKESLNVFLNKNPKWAENQLILNAVAEIKDRILEQNYAAAEDLLNRLANNDLELDYDFNSEDYLQEFLDDYDSISTATANAALTLKRLISVSSRNKNTKGAKKLLEAWPQSKSAIKKTDIENLFMALGFNVGEIVTEPEEKNKPKSYLIKLKSPENGKKNNYKHPISAFGSEAEMESFRVACFFGSADASRLIDTAKEMGTSKHTIILLDYALTLADRRILARKTKTDLTGKIFAVIDRVVLGHLIKHYKDTSVNRRLMSIIMPFASYQPYIDKSADVMPPEIFMGRKAELAKIESPTGINILYGGRQLGKTALLRMAKKDIDKDENGNRAIIVNVWGKNYRETARTISTSLFDEGILRKENITEDWDVLARDIKNRLREEEDRIPYLLLMIDEADEFIDSCEEIGYKPFNALKDIQSIGSGRFKFVVAGLRNIVRFKKTAALSNNSVLTHLESLTVKPFKAMEARELLQVPLSYLGFRFPKDKETEVLISTIFGTTNYFPGLIQLYCTKLIEAMKRDYAGYSEVDTPPYYVKKEHIKKILAEQSLQDDIREKFFITLKVDGDEYYYIIALLVAYKHHASKGNSGCDETEILNLSSDLSINKLVEVGKDKIKALMEEMCELNVLQHTGDGRYRFTRHSFCQMMGTKEQIDDELLTFMEEENA